VVLRPALDLPAREAAIGSQTHGESELGGLEAGKKARPDGGPLQKRRRGLGSSSRTRSIGSDGRVRNAGPSPRSSTAGEAIRLRVIATARGDGTRPRRLNRQGTLGARRCPKTGPYARVAAFSDCQEALSIAAFSAGRPIALKMAEAAPSISAARSARPVADIDLEVRRRLSLSLKQLGVFADCERPAHAAAFHGGASVAADSSSEAISHDGRPGSWRRSRAGRTLPSVASILSCWRRSHAWRFSAGTPFLMSLSL
jgi:hypothetical protein